MVKFFLGEVDKNKPNISEGFEEKLPKVVDYFAKIHGEKVREKYAEKLNNAIYVFVGNCNIDYNKFYEVFIASIIKLLKKKFKFEFSDKNKEWHEIYRFYFAPKSGLAEKYENILRHFYDRKIYRFIYKTYEEFIISPYFEQHVEDIKKELAPYVVMAQCISDELVKCTNLRGNSSRLIANFCARCLGINSSSIAHKYKYELNKFILTNPQLLSKDDKNDIAVAFNEMFNEPTQLNFDELANKYDLIGFYSDVTPFLYDLGDVLSKSTAKYASNVMAQIEQIKSHLQTTGASKQRGFIKEMVVELSEFCTGITNSLAFVMEAPTDDSTICVLPQNCDNLTVIHELQHVASTRHKVQNNKVISSVGLDFNEQFTRYGRYINEAVTQKFALLIDSAMYNDDVQIGVRRDRDDPYLCIAEISEYFTKKYGSLLDVFYGDSIKPIVDEIGLGNYKDLSDAFEILAGKTISMDIFDVANVIEYWEGLVITHKTPSDTPEKSIVVALERLKSLYESMENKHSLKY